MFRSLLKTQKELYKKNQVVHIAVMANQMAVSVHIAIW